jgi:hypothetical protein
MVSVVWLDDVWLVTEISGFASRRPAPPEHYYTTFTPIPIALISSSMAWHVLPPDLIELQLGQIDLLLAMYPEELTIDSSSQKLLEAVREIGDNHSVSIAWFEKTSTAPSVLMLLRVPIPSDTAGRQTLEAHLTVPFTHDGVEHSDDPPRVRVRVHQPSWLSKAATSQLMADLPEDEDLLGTIEYIHEAASRQLERSIASTAKDSAIHTASTASIVRVWFYFPSISTRSKRDDFITHAPSYSLTGFLYAGKPGLLCVEGGSQDIDDYMKFIKTESWGDIPAHHKKVSERYRETEIVERVFLDMTEITDLVGERRGQRANRGDMKAVEEWLVERGLGEAFGRVLM